jgi:hypothetical protein
VQLVPLRSAFQKMVQVLMKLVQVLMKLALVLKSSLM